MLVKPDPGAYSDPELRTGQRIGLSNYRFYDNFLHDSERHVMIKIKLKHTLSVILCCPSLN